MIPKGLSFNVKHVDNGGAADYQTDDGVCYPDICDIIHTGILDFCGCGDPESNLEFILEGLRYIDADKKELSNGQGFDAWYPGWVEKGNKLFGNRMSKMFFFYWAEKENLTEHGGSVTSSWLTKKGEDLVSDITILKESGLLDDEDE